MQKILVTFFSMLVLLCGSEAQQVMQLGDFKCISLQGPVMYYFKDARVINSFTKDLDSILYLKRGYKLLQNSTIEFSELTNKQENKAKNPTVFPRISFNIVEYAPFLYRKQFPANTIDSVLAKELLSVFLVESIIQTSENISTSQTVEIFLKQSISNGIGILPANLHLTGKGFMELLKTALSVVLDSSAIVAKIELKAAPAYLGDNFILNSTLGYPRIFFSNNKRISKFTYNGQQALLRWDEQRYKEILLSGKNKTNLSDSLFAAINNLRRVESGDFVFLLQEARDVVNNKNYRLEIPAYLLVNEQSEQTGLPTILPVEGFFHYLINEADTIARFRINLNIIDPYKKLLLHYSTNGIDSSSAFSVTNTSQQTFIKYLFEIIGIIEGQKMMITISTGLREIYINDEKIAIITGVTAPEKMVVLNPEISSTLLNELLLIAYNSFLQ